MPRKTPARHAKQIEIQKRRQQAVHLRTMHASYREIARQLGISVRQAWLDVKAVIDETARKTSEEYQHHVAIEERRLDAVSAVAFRKAVEGDLGAVETYRKLSESRRRLLGLDAPAQQKVEHDVGGSLADILELAGRGDAGSE